MGKRSRIIWRVGALVMVIIAVVIMAFNYVQNRASAHYAQESARAVLRFNSESILQGVEKLMMSRNNAAVEELITDMSRDNPVYGDIRLVDHHSGKVVASRFGRHDKPLDVRDESCLLCHRSDPPASLGAVPLEEIVRQPDGERLLSVVTPVMNKPGCTTASCHVHDDAGPILGFLQTDYSLSTVDALIARSHSLTLLAGVAAVLMSFLFLGLTFRHLLVKPIRNLIAGTRRIAEGDLAFRFETARNDEIGLLEASFNDMTARIHTHQSELKEAKDYLEGIVENTADIIVTLNRDGTIQTFNRGAERILGYARAEVVAQKVEILSADHAGRPIPLPDLNGHGPPLYCETQMRTKGGDVRDVLLTLSRLRDVNGNPKGILGIGMDITREKRLQVQMIQLERFAAIGQAVTGIQHAVKNMLHGLKGGAYLLRLGMEKDKPQTTLAGCEIVESAIRRIDGLSHSMLNYVKEWKPSFAPVDMEALAREVNREIKQAASDKGVAVETAVRDAIPPVLGDAKLIHMAILDLVTNALDACASKRYPDAEAPRIRLTLSLREDGKACVLEIRDNGCGMDEEIRGHIFTPFFSTKEEGGTGLGLDLVLKIVNIHGGRIIVESEPDRGSTFRLVFPMNGPRDNRGVA